MGLDEVIGIEIQRVSLGDRATQEGRRGGLIIDADEESTFNLVRRFDPQYVDYNSIQVRVTQGGWASAMTVVPNGLKSPPAVFVLDEECKYLRFPGGQPEQVDTDDWEGRVYSRMPLGSQLIGLGFAVAFPTPKTMARSKSPLAVIDWISLIRRFETKARIDPESLFLVATHEHAELAMKLAANIEFAGVVIEAPRELMFVKAAAKTERSEAKKGKRSSSKSDSKETSDVASGGSESGDSVSRDKEEKESFFLSDTHAKYYFSYANSLKEPALIILAKEAPDYLRTRKTLLTSLVAMKADFSAVLLDRWARNPMTSDEQREDWKGNRNAEDEEFEESDPLGFSRGPARDRRMFRYEEDQFEEWVARMENFLISHSKTEPRYLPAPDPRERGRGGSRNNDFGGLGGFSDSAGDFSEDSGMRASPEMVAMRGMGLKV